MLGNFKKLKKGFLIIAFCLVAGVALLIGFRPTQTRIFLENLWESVKKLIGKKSLKVVGDQQLIKNNFTEVDGKKAIEAVSKLHGVDMARLVERMFRLETRHFKSEQYKRTGTPGMEAGKWGNDVPKNLPTFQAHDADKSDGIDTFIIWNPTDCALFLAGYILRHGGNYARWNTTDVHGQQAYRNKVNEIKARFV